MLKTVLSIESHIFLLFGSVSYIKLGHSHAKTANTVNINALTLKCINRLYWNAYKFQIHLRQRLSDNK